MFIEVLFEVAVSFFAVFGMYSVLRLIKGSLKSKCVLQKRDAPDLANLHTENAKRKNG